ncbi:MAG TPA: AMP-binding protein [Streptosporangiaceae bacterium]|nr:AMP-binding protein [Streptosporangiaceae bacterium]
MPNAALPLWLHSQSSPGRTALCGTADQEWGYGTLGGHVAGIAAWLRQEAGIEPGDRVLLIAPSTPEFVAAYYAVLSAGAVAVTANPMSTAAELHYIGADADVALILCWHTALPASEAAAASLRVPCWPLQPGLAELPARRGLCEPHSAAADDTAAIIYTSGTTGQPKGAQLTHGNFTACVRIRQQVQGLQPDERIGTALPLFHVYGQACIMGTTMLIGASLALLPRFDPGEMLHLIRRHRLTVAAGVPTMWNAMLHAPAGDPEDFASLRIASSGGAPLPVEAKMALESRFGCTVLEGYGLTETTGCATIQTESRRGKPGSVGAPAPGCAISIRADDGTEQPAGTIGEVHVRGPVVMKGYWHRPEATGEVLRDGWFATGDLGILDDDGDLHIVDRKKDMVNRGGYKIYPREVEEVLYEHPDILEVAVIGVPDDHYGGEVGAVVVLHPGRAMEGDELRTWAKERLSAYKVPHLITFASDLPKGATGKILKRALDPSVFAGSRAPRAVP